MPIYWKQDQPAPKALRALIRAGFPEIREPVQTPDGPMQNYQIFADRDVRGSSKPSAHAEGRAMDIYLNAKDSSEKRIGDFLFSALRDQASELGLDHLIWNRVTWNVGDAAPSAYTGVHPHEDHVHVAWTREGSQRTQFPGFERALRNLGYQSFIFLADLRLEDKRTKWSTTMTLRFTAFGYGDGQGAHPFVRNRWNCQTPEFINLLAWDTHGYFWYENDQYRCYDKSTTPQHQPVFILENVPAGPWDIPRLTRPLVVRIEHPRNPAGRAVSASWRPRMV